MTKIVVVSTAPIFPTNNGYKSSVLGRIDELLNEDNEVVLIEINLENVTEKKDELIPTRFNNVQRYEVKKISRSFIAELQILFDIRTRYEQLFSSADIRDNIKKIIDLEKPSIIIAESIWALQALPIEISARIHCVIHDVATDFFKEMFVSHNEVVRKILFFNDYLKLKITEENIIKRLRVEQFIFLTEEDKCWYKTRYNIDECCCSLASNHLYVEKIKRTINFQTPFLLIPGSIEFSQNFYGLNWFIKNIYPGLNRKIRIVVTGKASDKKIKMLNCGEEITFTGELDFSTYNKLSSTCLCVIAPITTGTGIKIKILEAVQKGIPVLTTKFASKGICSDLCFYCEEDTDTNFVNLINSFLETTLRVQE